MAPLPILTIDVFEAIIDQASDHTLSLRQLSLLCSTFQPRARYHLFTHIHIQTVQQLESSHEFLRSHPWLPPLVKSVTFAIAGPEDKSFPNLRLLEVVPVHLLTQLPNVRAWRMSVGWNEQRRLSLHRSALSCYRKYWVGIQNLRLDYVTFCTVLDFKALVLSFACLRCLHCSHVRVLEKKGPSSTYYSGMSTSAQSLRIESLHIGPPVYIDVAECLFDASLVTLSNLVLSFYPDQLQRKSSEGLLTAIGQLSQLSSLTLALRVLGVRTYAENSGTRLGVLQDIRGLTKVLEHVDRSHLAYVQVDFVSDSIAGLGCPLASEDIAPCKALEDILLTFPRCRILLQDSILIRRAGRADFWSPIIKHAFPRLNEGGLLTLLCAKADALEPLGHEAPVTSSCMVSARDRQWMVTASQDGTIIVWDVSTGTVLQEWLAHKGPVNSLALSPDGQQFVSAGGVSGETLVVWNIDNGVRRVAALEGHTKPATCCDWSFDGTLIASASEDGTVRIWDGLTFEPLDVLNDPRAVSEPGCLMFFGDACHLAWVSGSPTGEGDECRIWEPLTVLKDHPPKVLLSQSPHPSRNWSINVLAIDPQCRRIAAVHNGLGEEPHEHVARIWDIATGAELAILAGHTGEVREVAFAPGDGASVLTASQDGFVKIWDVESASGREIASLAPSGGDVRRACFSPDGTRIVTVSSTTVQLWRARDLSCVALLSDASDRGEWPYQPEVGEAQVQFSTDGEFIAFGGLDGIIHFRRLSDFVAD